MINPNLNLRILVIDDNPEIHQDFIKILMRDKHAQGADQTLAHLEKNIFGEHEVPSMLPNFEIDTASQGQEGVMKIKEAIKQGKPYALAFVDIRMPPGWDGVETIKHIWAEDRNIQVVICTAYSDYTWEETVEELGEKDNLLILKKPFDNIAVRQLASALTKKWQLIQDAKSYTYQLEASVQERTQSLKQSLSLMRATMESSADGILVVDNQGALNDYNQKFLDIFDIPKSLLESNKFQLVIEFIASKTEDSNLFLAQIEKINTNKDEVLIGKFKFTDKKYFEYYSQPYSLGGDMVGRVWSFRDITKRASLEEELQFQATHDLLTGLPNRILLLERIREAMLDCDKNDTKFAIMFLDLDRFKLINDSLNHEAGDEILRVVTRRLQRVIADNDTLARLGGDEFVVLIKKGDSRLAVSEYAEKILSVFLEPFHVYYHEIILTTSIGICIYPNNGANIDLLLRNADTAMYHAKDLGANQFQFYSEELNQKILEKLEKESELRQALIKNEFYLCYQPQFELLTEKLVSVEALIRWKHPTKGIVLPIDFIPLAEETGLIIPIGEWVLRHACEQNKKWQDDGLEPIRIAVNITTKQFRLYNLVETIANILKETKLEAKYLELELTENMIINNKDIINTVNDLKAMGLQIVLDDFGTGYSSLNYLRELPVDRLKIDQSYVQNIESNRGDDVIIQAIIAMANSLNLEVLAEGVETKGQLDFLRAQKVGEVQGFYFSKPISANDCEGFMRKVIGKKNHIPPEKE